MISRIRLSPNIGKLLLLSGFIGVLLMACSTGGNTQTGSSTPTSTGFHTSAKTSDGLFLIQFSVTPNKFGMNTFTASVADANSRKPTPDLTVQLTTTMLDMNMGTDSVVLQSAGNGKYSAQGQLSMSGNWEIGMQIRTTDKTLHIAKLKLYTPA